MIHSFYHSLINTFSSLNSCYTLVVLIIALAVLGMILQKFREEKPSWLLEFEVFSNKLQGFWTPLFIVVAPLAFLYNVACTAVYAIITLLELLIKLLKWLYHWLWSRAFMWFWQNVIVIPIVLLAKVVWHYLILWPWRIYYQSYHTVWKSINRKTVTIGWISATAAFVIAGIFRFLSIILEVSELEYVGFVLCLIPIIFGLGTIASMRSKDDLLGQSMSIHKKQGIASAIKATKYIVAALVIILLVSGISMTGSLNKVGIIILGVTINISHALGIVGVGVLSIIAVMVALIPGYSIANPKTTFRQEFVDLILLGRDKILQYALAGLFAILFTGLIAIVPTIITGLAFKGTSIVKEKVLSSPYANHQETLIEINKALMTDTLNNEKWIDKVQERVSKEQILYQLEYLSAFPKDIVKNPDVYLNVDTLFWIRTELVSMTKEYEEKKNNSEKLLADLDNEISELEIVIKKERAERSTYMVQRSSDEGESWNTVGEDIDVKGFKDLDLDSESEYIYRVIASNKSGSSKNSNEARAKTNPLKIANPTKFSANAESNFRVVLEWNDRSWNESGFLIERSIDKDEWYTVNTVGKNTTRYVDSKIKDTTYYYRLTAVSNSDSSNKIVSNRVYPRLVAPRAVAKEKTHNGILIEWRHNDNYQSNKNHGESTKNNAPTIDFEAMSTLDILLEELNSLKLKQENILKQQAKDDNKFIPRIEFLSDIKNSTFTSLSIRYIGFILGLLALAALAGFIVAFILAYIGSLLWPIHQLNDGESYFFVEKIKEIRTQSPNQPLLGFLILGLLTLFLYLTSCPDSFLDRISLSNINNLEMANTNIVEAEIEGVDNSIVVEELTSKVVEYFEYEVKGDSETLWDELEKAFPELGYHELNMIIKENPHWKNKAGNILIIPEH